MSTMTTEAIRKTVLVDFAPAEAFELFTARIASWWPVGTHSYGGDAVKDVVLEPRSAAASTRSPTRASRTGRRVLAWEPPHRLLLDWQIGEARGTEVEVRFSPEGPARASSSSTAASSAARSARARYDSGWDVVLAPSSSGALDADVDRLPGRAVAQQAADELGEPPRREQLPRSRPARAGVHQRSPVTYSAASCSGVKRGSGLEARASARARTARPDRPTCRRGTGSRAPASRSTAPARRSSRPTSSASSRTIACSCDSPGSSPPPGVAHTTPCSGTRSERARAGRPGRARRRGRPCRSLTATPGTPETSAAARPTAPRRSRATSTEAPRAPSRRGGAPAHRAPARSPNAPR